MPSSEARAFSLAYIEGEVRDQQMMFPPTLADLVPGDHVVRVIGAFVGMLGVGG